MKFIRDKYPDVQKESPALTMAQLIVKNKIPPTRQMRYCCRLLKENGGVGRVKITGIRSEESPRRAKRSQVEVDKDGTKFVHVIKTWTSADVWQFIRENNLPYCSLYDEGFDRIGCVLCPFQTGANTERDLKRFPSIVEYYRQACRKSFEANQDKFTGKRKSAKWTSGDDLFEWWIHERHSVKARDSSLRGSLHNLRIVRPIEQIIRRHVKRVGNHFSFLSPGHVRVSFDSFSVRVWDRDRADESKLVCRHDFANNLPRPIFEYVE